MKHKIYLLEIKEYAGWDSYDKHIVIADEPKEARKMCPIGDEGKECWIDKKYSTIKMLGYTNLSKKVIISSFNAG